MGEVQAFHSDQTTTTTPVGEHADSLSTVLDLVRSGIARTRPEIGRHAGLGRTVVTQRVTQLTASGLLEEGALGPSSGGRAPRELRFRARAGVILAAELGATSISVGVTDLAGVVLAEHTETADIAAGPETVLSRVEEVFDDLLPRVRAELGSPELPVWGVGVGLPGPVEFATGRPSAPPIMPGWDGYPVRDRFARRYDTPVWVDNEVNTMALGELRAGSARGQRDILYVKIGTGIGAGLISNGTLHRGSQGCAGDIGHAATSEEDDVVCRCGNTGCLEAYAGGAALARDGLVAAKEGRSRFLADVLATTGTVTAADVSRAAQSGDRTSVELLTRAGRLVGTLLATLVSFFNPALVIIGGGVSGAGDLLLAAVRRPSTGARCHSRRANFASRAPPSVTAPVSSAPRSWPSTSCSRRNGSPGGWTTAALRADPHWSTCRCALPCSDVPARQWTPRWTPRRTPRRRPPHDGGHLRVTSFWASSPARGR